MFVAGPVVPQKILAPSAPFGPAGPVMPCAAPHDEPLNVSTVPVAGAVALMGCPCSCVALPLVGDVMEKKGIAYCSSV
jgi:hypothetical protein